MFVLRIIQTYKYTVWGKCSYWTLKKILHVVISVTKVEYRDVRTQNKYSFPVQRKDENRIITIPRHPKTLCGQTSEVFFSEGGVGQIQAWIPACASILGLCIPQMIWVWTATVGWYDDMVKPKNSEKKPVPVPLCRPLVPYGLTRAWTWASAVRGRRLTTSAIARPNFRVIKC
jgi:hypothetical protein